MDGKDKKIYEMYFDKKMTCAEIARVLEMSTAGVSKRIRGNGWKARNRGDSIELRHTDDYNAMFVEYQAGASVVDLAKKYVVAESTVRNALTKRGIAFLKKDNSSYDSRIYEEYFKNNKSLAGVAEIVNLPISSVQERFKINGWEMRSRQKAAESLRKFDREAVIEEYLRGKSSVYLAHKYGISSQTIRLFLHKNKIKMRNPAISVTSAEELIFQDILNELKIPYQCQVSVPRSDGKKRDWVFDFQIQNYLIEINGEFYHNNYFVQEKDIRKSQDAKNAGFETIAINGRATRYGDLLKSQIQCLLLPGTLDDYSAQECVFSDVAGLVHGFHYLGTTPYNIKRVFRMVGQGGNLVGACVFSGPIDTKYDGYLELSRLILLNGLPKNAGSWFLSRCLKAVGVPVVTYADPDLEHLGTIYRSCNFQYVGDGVTSYCYVAPSGRYLNKRSVYVAAKKLRLKEWEYAQRQDLVKVEKAAKKIFLYKV